MKVAVVDLANGMVTLGNRAVQSSGAHRGKASESYIGTAGEPSNGLPGKTSKFVSSSDLTCEEEAVIGSALPWQQPCHSMHHPVANIMLRCVTFVYAAFV